MKFITLTQVLILMAFVSFHGSTSASKAIDKTLSAKADGIVEIHNVRGKIRIEGWEKNEVNIKGTLDDLAEKLIFKTKGKVTQILVKMPRKKFNLRNGSDLVIKVPEANRIDFNGVSTDLLIENISGGVDINSISGDIDIVNVKKQLYINSVSGDISLSKSSGNTKLDSVSGDIVGEIDSKDIFVNAVSGDVVLNLSEFNIIRASTVSGDLKIDGNLNDSGKVGLSNVTGDITLSLNNPVNARVSVCTSVGGDIFNKLSSDSAEKVFPGQQKLLMTLGDGSGLIKIDTVNGTIKLREND